MMDVTELSFILPATAALILILLYILSIRNKSRYPPGPSGYPVLGNLPQIDFSKGIHIKCEEWRQKYGDMFTIRFGARPVLILNGYDMIHEAFVTYGDKFMDRPELYVAQLMFRGRGIFLQPFSSLWKEIRRLVLTTMRDLGVGKASLEEKIIEEVNAIKTEVLKHEEKPFEIRKLIQYAMANVICSINFGIRMEYDDPKFIRLIDLLNELFSLNPVGSILNFFPWLRFVPGVKQTLMRPVEIIKATRVLVEGEIENHRASFDPNNIRDFVDVFLKAEQECTTDKDGVFMDGQLFQTICDLFNAGSETAATSISWTLLYLIRNPDAQQRCHNELDKVVGQGRHCSMKDRPNLPFIDACIMESMRKGNIAPMVAPHAARCDVDFHGYNIPKGTMVWASLWSVHNDSKYWPDPFAWKPERWLDENNKIIRHEAYMPFSTGFRSCAGQQLAQMELFIILTHLLQHFRFTHAPGQAPPPDEGIAGVTRRPLSYKLCAIKR